MEGKTNMNSIWKLVPSAVYYTIQTDDGCLICFMSIDEKDREIARHICDLHNQSLIVKS